MSRHVTGIGGLFFRSDDHKALSKWYNEHFGINNEENGYIWQPGCRAHGVLALQARQRLLRRKQQFMLNLRVQDLDGLLKKLEADGVRIDPKRRTRTTAASRGYMIRRGTRSNCGSRSRARPKTNDVTWRYHESASREHHGSEQGEAVTDILNEIDGVEVMRGAA
jgi:glyoxylase I family protein